MSEHDAVNHPSHYTSHPSGIETIELIRGLPFVLGSAVKYVSRHRLKGNPKQDLEKAQWNLKDALKQEIDWRPDRDTEIRAWDYVRAEPDPMVALFLSAIFHADGRPNYMLAASALREMLVEREYPE